jgi:RNA polymerase sigma-70 factor (ECF subfamily)
LHLTRGDLLERLGRRAEAAQEFQEAMSLTANPAERRLIADRIEQVASAADPVRGVADD